MRQIFAIFAMCLLVVVGLLGYLRQEPSTAWWMVIESRYGSDSDLYLTRSDGLVVRQLTNHAEYDGEAH